MKIITRSNFYDFTGQTFVWKYFLQSLFLPGVYYYIDWKQGVWCREIRNVRGKVVLNQGYHYIGKENVMDACFVPFDLLHPFLHYHQMIWDYEEFQKV